MNNRPITVKRVFLQLCSDRLLHNGEAASKRGWESLKLSGQAPGERESMLAFSFSVTTFRLCCRFADAVTLLSRVFYNSITQVSTTGVSASDTRSGDRVGSDARSRTKAMRTQATSARASWNGDKRIVLSCPRIDKLAT